MVTGESGVLAICPPEERPRYARASDRLEWPNGAVSQIFSAEEPDRLRGKQHMKLWLDELAAWRDPDAFDQAMLGLRLGDSPQAVITTTPRPTKLIKQLIGDKNVVVTRGSTFDNSRFLADAFIERIAARFEGRAIGRQELYAEIVEETPAPCGRARSSSASVCPRYAAGGICRDRRLASIRRRAPAPRLTNAESSSSAARPAAMIHVLADLTTPRRDAGQWSARVVAAFRRFAANRVVAEINNGGEMVTEVLRQNDPNLPVRNSHRYAREIPARRADCGGL